MYIEGALISKSRNIALISDIGCNLGLHLRLQCMLLLKLMNITLLTTHYTLIRVLFMADCVELRNRVIALVLHSGVVAHTCAVSLPGSSQQ